MQFLFDTCVLLWWTVDPGQLSPQAKSICDAIEDSQGYVSAVSIWEIGIKIKNRKLDIGMSIERYVDRLQEITSLVILPVDLPVWVKSLELNWAHRDPADRLIVASALINDFYILTSDRTIANFYPKWTF